MVVFFGHVDVRQIAVDVVSVLGLRIIFHETLERLDRLAKWRGIFVNGQHIVVVGLLFYRIVEIVFGGITESHARLGFVAIFGITQTDVQVGILRQTVLRGGNFRQCRNGFAIIFLLILRHAEHVHIGALHFFAVALVFFQIIDCLAVVFVGVGRFAQNAIGFGVVFAVWPARNQRFAIFASLFGVAHAVVYLQRMVGGRLGVGRIERQLQKSIDGFVVVFQTKFGVRIVVERIFFVDCFFAVERGKQDARGLIFFEFQVSHAFGVEICHVFRAIEVLVLHLVVPFQRLFVFFTLEC